MAAIALRNARRADRLETLLVASAVFAVAACAVGYATLRGTAAGGPPQLLDWQVSAFADLNEDDQAIHSALAAAAEDIGSMNYDFGDWITPEEADKLLMPPFYKDDFWTLHGSAQWERLGAADYNQGGDTSYIGRHAKNPGQSAYLLVFRHRHIGAGYTNQTEIWVHKDVNVANPDGYRAESLARAGWRQVINYSGAEEVARMKGN
jgi:hypothetical protein